MSLSTLKKNFYRIASLIIDHGAESMRCLLDHFIQRKYRISFQDFVSNHQHEIYHHFNNGICCLCSKNYRRPYKTVIGAWQMEKLFDKNSQKLACHKHSSKCEYCCSTIKSTMQLQDIDITLLRFFLVTYFEEEFWQSCFTSGIVFHDFLNTHKHDIFHLLQLNTPCCVCLADPGYTTMDLNEKDRLNRTQWEKMFQTSEFPCIQHRSYCPNGYTLNPCSVSATIGISHSDLDGRVRMIVLSKFCTMMRHIDGLVNARNTSFAHAIKGELSDKEFRQLWIEIENSIIYISNITSTVDSRKLCMLELREKSLEESMCLELQCLILKQVHGDEHVLQACCKLQDTVEKVQESIDRKLQQINQEIIEYTSNMSDIVRNELSVQLNEYSDTTRNIIDNSRREIEYHDEDKTYVKTSSVTAAIEILESKNLLILIGRAGSGKTSTALEIASVFHGKDYIVMKLEQNLAQDFKAYFISKNKQLVIFEDLFGKADIRFDVDIHSNLLKVLKPHVSNGVSKFIITVRSCKGEIDDEIDPYNQMLLEAGVVNFNKKFALSNFEKERILSMHATHYGLDIRFLNMQSITQANSYLGFPEACRLFCSFEKFFAMGHEFFTSPTEELQKEIRFLKQSGYMNIDSALQYCVLVCLMLDSASEDAFTKNMCGNAYENNDSSNNCKNIDNSVIEHLYQILFDKEIMIPYKGLHEICKQLSNRYIKSDLNSNEYVFQHLTVFEAVLYSYWHNKTMENVIKYFKVDILAEHVRPFDSVDKCKKRYLIVPMTKCTSLAHKLCETFLADCSNISKWSTLINQSEFTLNLFNLKLNEWYTIEENIRNCSWSVISEFIRPFNYKMDSNEICAHTKNKYLIHRILDSLDVNMFNDCDIYDVHSYITRYACDEFVKDFNEQLKERFQLEENVINCKWNEIQMLLRPTSFKQSSCQIGTATKNVWLIETLMNRLLGHGPVKCRDTRLWEIKGYIEEYGCETFIKDFNDKLKERLKSEENVIHCSEEMVEYFIRPTSFQIENCQVGTVTKDCYLINWLVKKLLSRFSKQTRGERIWDVKYYIKMYGCKSFINDFNKRLTESVQSEANVINCKWKVIQDFIRPTTFQIENGKIGSVTNDVWLINRIINILLKHKPFQPIPNSFIDYELLTPKYDRALEVRDYIVEFGCETFVKDFNDKLKEWFQSDDNKKHWKWNVIRHFIRPTTFKIEVGKIGTVTKNDWLIHWLIDMLMEQGPFNLADEKHEQFNLRDERAFEVRDYVQKYGCETFVKDFNYNLMERFQSREIVENCKWAVIQGFIRPTTFKIENGQVGTVNMDDWLIQRLIDVLVKPRNDKAFKIRDHIEKYGSTILDEDYYKNNGDEAFVKDYIEKYGCDAFVKDFNGKLMERFNSKTILFNCKWEVIHYFIRPKTFQIENGQVGTVIRDDWLIHGLVNKLLEHKPDQKGYITSSVKYYVEKYGCEKFIKNFNLKLSESFQSEEHIEKCNWEVIHNFICPTTYTKEAGHIGAVTHDVWLINRLIDLLDGRCLRNDDRTREVKDFIEKFKCETFVNDFNHTLTEKFQSSRNVINCSLEVIYHFIRPNSFQFKIGEVGTVTNDTWLIHRLINIMVDHTSFLQRDDNILGIKVYIERYGCETFVENFDKHLKEWFELEKNTVICDWEVIQNFIRPTTFKIQVGRVGTAMRDDWLIHRLISILVKRLEFTSRDNLTGEVNNFIKKYGCDTFVKDFNKKLAEWLKSEKNAVNCEWDVICQFIRPKRFNIEIGTIEISIEDSWLIQRLIKELTKYTQFESGADRTRNVNGYIKKYGCEQFVKHFNERLKEWILKNMESFDWSLFTTFVRPQSWSYDLKKGIRLDDEIISMYLISELKQPMNVYAVTVYIETYGSSTFIKKFIESVKEKQERCYALGPKCEWDLLDNIVQFYSEEFLFTNEENTAIENDFRNSEFCEYFDIDYDVHKFDCEYDDEHNSEFHNGYNNEYDKEYDFDNSVVDCDVYTNDHSENYESDLNDHSEDYETDSIYHFGDYETDLIDNSGDYGCDSNDHSEGNESDSIDHSGDYKSDLKDHSEDYDSYSNDHSEGNESDSIDHSGDYESDLKDYSEDYDSDSNDNSGDYESELNHHSGDYESNLNHYSEDYESDSNYHFDVINDSENIMFPSETPTFAPPFL